MSLHPDVVEALDLIDAAVFSSDSFQTKEGRETLREHLQRWVKWDAEACYFLEDGTMMSADNTRSIFDDVDE